jgi:hypothetical protein
MRQTNRILCLMAASVFVLAAQSDPPGRVGRLSYLSGPVSFRPGDVEDWVGAEVNRPVTSGDHVWVDEGGRAELNIGNAALRLDSRTAFEFLNLDDAGVQIRLTDGSLHVRLRNLGDRETFEVDTPNLAFSLLRPGDYRIDVDSDRQTTTVAVRDGQGEVTGGNQAFNVRPGEQARVSGIDQPSYETLGSPPPDEWDRWCSARDRREDQSPSARYVSREMVGYQDLDDNGSWRNVPDYGSVWVPRSVDAGWAPYRYGHWVWMDPWGWTWVDDAPWGFAPFHYGRWVYVGYWAWVPGPVAVRPVYAPALVAWVGGPRFSLAIGVGGGVAWFPLGPREVYVPSYNASPTYINRVNVTNTTIVNNINVTNINTTNINYVNRSAPGGVTAVSQAAFSSARPVQSAAVSVRPEMLRSAQVMTTAQVAPSRQSVVGNAAPTARVAQPPAAVQNRAVVAKTTPPPPPVPFVQKQQALSSNAGRPLDAGQVQQLRSVQPVVARPYVRQAQAPVPQVPVPPAGQVNRPAGQPPVQAIPPQPVQPRPADIPPRNADRPVQPLDRPVQPPRDRPVQPLDRPVQPQVERPVQPQVVRPVQPQVERPVQPQVDRPVRPQVDRPVQPPPPPPPQPREVQRPPQPQNRPAEKADRPAPKKDDKREKKDEHEQH